MKVRGLCYFSDLGEKDALVEMSSKDAAFAAGYELLKTGRYKAVIVDGELFLWHNESSVSRLKKAHQKFSDGYIRNAMSVQLVEPISNKE